MNYLVADIGGTNARFSFFKIDKLKSNEKITLEDVIEFPSKNYTSFLDLLEDFFSKNTTLCYQNIQKCIFAVTGVQNGRHTSTGNLPFTITSEEIYSKYTDFPEIMLINDFSAQAMACLTPAAENFVPIFNGKAQNYPIEDFPLIVMGAGTGLGSACLVKQNAQAILLPSEGGDRIFPFLLENEDEKAFSSFLCTKKKIPYPTVDTVLSGSGLAQLHTFLTGEKIHPKNIPSNSNTFKRFSIFFARALRDYALTMMSKTIVISGGIIAKHPHILDENFIEEFLHSHRFRSELEQMTILLNKDEHAALYGATFFI